MQYNTIQMNRFTWIETEIHSMQPSFNTINLSFFKQTLSRLDYIFVMSLWTKYIYKYQRSFFFSLFSFKPYCNLAMNQPIWTIQKKTINYLTTWNCLVTVLSMWCFCFPRARICSSVFTPFTTQTITSCLV